MGNQFLRSFAFGLNDDIAALGKMALEGAMQFPTGGEAPSPQEPQQYPLYNQQSQPSAPAPQAPEQMAPPPMIAPAAAAAPAILNPANTAPVAEPPPAEEEGPSLIDMIKANTTREASSYGTLFNNAEREPGGPFEGVDLTKMTVGEVKEFTRAGGPYERYVAAHNDGNPNGPAAPTGRFQVVHGTLIDHANRAGVSDDELYSPEVQDKIAESIYKVQGPKAWVAWGGKGEAGTGSSQVTMSGRNNPTNRESDSDDIDMSDMEDDLPNLSPKAQKMRRWGAALEGLGRGLSQMSRGDPIDLSEVMERYAKAQAEMYDRLDEFNKEKYRRGERKEDRRWATEDIEDEQAFRRELQEDSQAQETSERLGAQTYGTSERVDTQYWTAEQSDVNRDWQSKENEAGRLFTGSENRLNEAHELGLQDDQQSFTTKQTELQQEFEKGQQERLFDQQNGTIKEEHTFQKAQSTQDRAWQLGYLGKQQEFTMGMQIYQNMYEAGREDMRANNVQEVFGDLVPNANKLFLAGGIDAVNDAADRARTTNDRSKTLGYVQDLASSGDETYTKIASAMEADPGLSLIDAYKEFKPADDPVKVQEFNFMRGLDKDGQEAYLDFITKGGTTFNIGDKKETIALTAAFNSLGEDRKELLAGKPGYQAFQAIAALNAASPDGRIESGALSQLSLKSREYLMSAHLLSPENELTTTLQGTLDSLGSMLIGTVRQPGSTTEMEFSQYLKAVPNSGNAQIKNHFLEQYGINSYRARMQEADLKEQYILEHGNTAHLNEFLNEKLQDGTLQATIYSTSTPLAIKTAATNGNLKVGDLIQLSDGTMQAIDEEDLEDIKTLEVPAQ